MAADAIGAASKPLRAADGLFSGLVLAAGAAALFVGTLFYARLTPELGLPALPSGRAQALADALSVGARPLALAGGWSFAGDCLLLAACLALAPRAARKDGSLELAGWALIAVSVTVAIMFDSMTAALFWPLAQASDPQPFLALKAWFDFLFATANVPFGLGFIAVLVADAKGPSPLVARPLTAIGLLVGATAAVSGLGEATGLLHLPLVIGLSVTFGCVVLAALGVQMLRGAREQAPHVQTWRAS